MLEVPSVTFGIVITMIMGSGCCVISATVPPSLTCSPPSENCSPTPPSKQAIQARKVGAAPGSTVPCSLFIHKNVLMIKSKMPYDPIILLLGIYSKY